MTDKTLPVAFFDSSLGGISVLREAVRMLPHEDFLYYGDSLHAPYGVRPVEEVAQLSRDAVQMLLGRGIKAFVGTKKKYSTDANLAGLSHEAEDLESMETSMRIVKPTMGVWPEKAPARVEQVKLSFLKGRCVAVNDRTMTPYDVMVALNQIGGRNGIGMKHALENRIIGTKSRGVYEAPGMEVLSWGLKYIYEGIMDRRSTKLFQELSKFVADQIYDGRWFDPATQAARAAIQVWADKATADRATADTEARTTRRDATKKV